MKRIYEQKDFIHLLILVVFLLVLATIVVQFHFCFASHLVQASIMGMLAITVFCIRPLSAEDEERLKSSHRVDYLGI